MEKTRRRTVALAVLTLVAAGLVPVAAHAANGGAVSSAPIAPASETPEFNEGEDTSDWPVQFSDLQDALMADYADFYVTSEITGQHTASISLAKEPSDSLTKLVATVPGVSIRVEAETVPIEEQGAFVSAIGDTIDEFFKEQPGGYGFDWRRHAVTLYFGDITGQPGFELENLQRAIDELELKIRFTVQDGPEGMDALVGTAGHDAGRSLFYGSGPCTSAFPVKQNGGAHLGVLTAGHCPGAPVRYGTPTASTTMLSVLAGSQITDDPPIGGGDMRWFRSSEMFSGLTRVNTGPRKFTSHIRPTFGQYLCRAGHSSDMCGTINAVDIYYSDWVPVNATTNVWRRMGPMVCVYDGLTSGAHATNGDSGGPWYSGPNAAGIQSAGNPPERSVSCMTQVRNALARFDVSLWQG